MIQATDVRRDEPAAHLVSSVTVLEQAIARVDGGEAALQLARAADAARIDPARMAAILAEGLGDAAKRVVVTGVLERRVVLIQTAGGRWIVCHLGSEPVGVLPWPARVAEALSLDAPGERVSAATLAEAVARRLWEPHVRLVALYHPEIFPVPRFPLGISAIARAIRGALQGRVSLCDMQLGPSLDDVAVDVARERPDILGISATFGQHDLLVALLDRIPPREEGGPLVVLGGSLPALNASILLERSPSVLVARGAGEATMCDVVSYWLGDLELSRVRGISYGRDGRAARSARLNNSTLPDFLPELDLLEPTLERGGVMQLESSRGCTHSCSFCPREHKGAWAGDEPARLDVLLETVAASYRRFPYISRKIFLVDEEFIGHRRDGSALDRAADVAMRLSAAGFRWETSARVDQIHRPDRDRAWHAERMRFWTRLRQHGLDRCLFGIESGVDSILRRFNKQTTAAQNALALRLLTACGIPIRCTYITFDPLMTLEELAESHRFQGRTDLLLRPVQGLSFEELFDAVQDAGFARAHTTGEPLYSQITYMLVSMECLIGSPYLRRVEEAGLAREVLPAMGRRNAVFRDPAIGRMSDCGQRWIDRNFSFDYALKGLEKITVGDERAALRRMRLRLKLASYTLLGEMLALAEEGAGAVSRERLLERMGHLFARLVAEVHGELERSTDAFLPERYRLLAGHYTAWRARTSWELING